MTRTAIALGSNQGDRLGYIRTGIAGIRRLGTVISVSSLYETEPVGGPDQDRYLNAVVLIETDLEPHALLAELHRLEEAAGRTRGERWGPRTLDLDIIAHRADPVDMPDLTIPHPLAAERRFVLEPLAEIWPQAPLGEGVTAEHALAGVEPGGTFRWSGDWEVGAPNLGWRSGALVGAQVGLIATIVVVGYATLVSPVSPLRSAIAAALAVPGTWLVVSAALALGSRLSALPEPRPGDGLIERGPFRRARHPIYGGVILGTLAMVVISGSWWALVPAAALGAVLVTKVDLEERALTLAFPDYPDYRRRVRKRFLPFLI